MLLAAILDTSLASCQVFYTASTLCHKLVCNIESTLYVTAFQVTEEGSRQSPVQQLGGGVVEAICRGEAPVLGSASIDSCAHFGRQHLSQLHTPLVEAVQAPNKPLHVPHKSC